MNDGFKYQNQQFLLDNLFLISYLYLFNSNEQKYSLILNK